MTNPEEPPPEVEWDFDADWRRRCDIALAKAKASGGNPLVLWELLADWHRHGIDKRMRDTPMEVSTLDMLHQPVPRPPLPVWAQDWLAEMARGMSHLVAGRDARTRPDDNASPAEYMRWMRQGTLSAPQCAALVPLALGITREAGWNAFDRYWALQEAEAAAQWKDMLTWLPTAEGEKPALSRGEAHRQVMMESGFTDDRAFRRFLKKGRTAETAGEHPMEKRLRGEAQKRAKPPSQD